MDIKKLKDRKKQLGYTNKQLSEISGVPLGTIQKIFGNTTANPRRETYIALSRALNPDAVYDFDHEVDFVREEVFAYEVSLRGKKQGEYTVEDYDTLPDDIRAEIIDGYIYYMGAPTTVHQLIAAEIYHMIMDCIDEHEVDCFPFISPVDVELDKDKKTIVQPDMIMICNRDILAVKRIYGAPEFIVEVLSPSTRAKDQFVKLNKYRNAGCREVWIVDPDNQRIMVYDFGSENYPNIYSFDDKVPVAVSKGICEIDFQKIKRRMKRLFPEDK